MDSVPVDSVPVIPWPFRNPPEFRGTEIIILAGTTAKIPFRGIPGIDRIPPDSGRNTWGTVKNSLIWTFACLQVHNQLGIDTKFSCEGDPKSSLTRLDLWFSVLET